MSTLNELERQKLIEEIRLLKSPFWKKPSYLTVIISALTIIITAAIGFSTYFQSIDELRDAQIKELEEKIRLSKLSEDDARFQLQNLESETYRLRYEDFRDKATEKQELLQAVSNELNAKEQNLREIRSKVIRVTGEVEKYISEEYAPGYARGILDNPDNVAEMRKYADGDQELNELRQFITWVIIQSYKRANEERQERLSVQLEKL